jgi:hypothetical protein
MTPVTSPLLGIMDSGITGNLINTNYYSISTATVDVSGASSISFSSIPQTYTHLQLRIFNQTNRSTYNTSGLYMRLGNNGIDSGYNYSYHGLQSNPASPSNLVNSYAVTSSNYGPNMSTSSSVASNVFGVGVIDIVDYKNVNKYKTVRCLSGSDTNGAASGYAGYIDFGSFLWTSTNAVTDLAFYPLYGTAFNQYSTFELFGVK